MLRALRKLQRDNRVEKALLCPVVEVTDDAAARLVARGDHARAGGGELIAAVRVRDRGVDQPRQLSQALLGTCGWLVSRLPARGDDAPDAVLDRDRRADRHVDVRTPGEIGDVAVPLLREVDPRRTAAPQDA